MGPTLSRQLDRLETVGLIRQAADEAAAYLFRHALVQDAAYASLLRADRKRLHRAVARTLEALGGSDEAGLAPLLGEHYRAAGEHDLARAYFARAGAAALARYANREAETYYRAALALDPRPPTCPPCTRGWPRH